VTAENDTLVKPDMVAVLQRTHVSKDLHGFLLPTLEAVSNAMHGIEARFGGDARKQGTIEIAMSSINDPPPCDARPLAISSSMRCSNVQRPTIARAD
jgi:hypothetical protein